MKEKFFVVVLLAMSIICGGCGKEMSEQEKKVEQMTLTPRQEEIVKDEFNVSYEELSGKQKEDIAAIEELLQYLESKYNREFCYEGYLEKGIQITETLYAYPKGSEELLVTVTRTIEAGEERIDDNYESLIRKEEYCTFIAAFWESLGLQVKVYTDPEIFRVVDAKKGEFQSNVVSNNMIFLPAGLTEAQFEEMTNQYCDWIHEMGLTTRDQVVSMKDGYFGRLTEEYYADYLETEYYDFRVDCN